MRYFFKNLIENILPHLEGIFVFVVKCGEPIKICEVLMSLTSVKKKYLTKSCLNVLETDLNMSKKVKKLNATHF